MRTAQPRTRRTAKLAAMGTALIAAAVLVMAPTAAAEDTQAAWTDVSYVAAPVSAGTWQVDPQCQPVDRDGNPFRIGSCSVRSVTFIQGTDGAGNIVRDYYISVWNNLGWISAPRVTVSLTNATGFGSWTWGTAATQSTGQYTATPGFACSELPYLRATGRFAGGVTDTFRVRVVQNGASLPVSERTCS